MCYIAVLDKDVFDESINEEDDNYNESFHNIYIWVKIIIIDIYSLGVTPEVWLMGKIEKNDQTLNSNFKSAFNVEIQTIIKHQEYINLDVKTERRLAKKKLNKFCEIVSNKTNYSISNVEQKIVE